MPVQAQRQLVEQFSGRFGVRRLPDAKVEFELSSLLLDTRCVGAADLDHAASGGVASETGTPEVGAQIVHKGGVAQSNQHWAAVLLYPLRPAASTIRPSNEP
jgi:hypothetical protein